MVWGCRGRHMGVRRVLQTEKGLNLGYNLKAERKDLAGGVNSIPSVPSDFRKTLDGALAESFWRPPCSLYEWRIPPRHPFILQRGILFISHAHHPRSKARWLQRLRPCSCPAPPHLRLDPKIKSRQNAGAQGLALGGGHFVDAP